MLLHPCWNGNSLSHEAICHTLQAYFRYWQYPTTLCEPVSWTRGIDMPHLCHASWACTVRIASLFPTNLSLHKKSSSWKISGRGKVCGEWFWVGRRRWLVRGRWMEWWGLFNKGTGQEEGRVITLCSQGQFGGWTWSVAPLHSFFSWQTQEAICTHLVLLGGRVSPLVVLQ